MSSLSDVWNSIVGIFASGDLMTLAVMISIALVIGYLTRTFGSIVTSTFIALVLFALATYLRLVATAGGRNAGALAQSGWHDLLNLTLQNVLAYAITFAVFIAVVHFVRSRMER